MKEVFDSSITIYNKSYTPVEIKEYGSGVSKSINYRYKIDDVTIFLGHFVNDIHLWSIAITKCDISLNEFFNSTDIVYPKYECIWVVPIDDVNSEIEKAINNLN